jgi:N-acetylglucosamine malate deacetylase 1
MVEFYCGEKMTRIVAVVAAHPDDEVLGCGGVMARHARDGDAVHVLIIAEGATSRGESRSREAHQSALSELREAAIAANRILGAASVELLQFPDNRLDSVDLLEIVKSVELFLGKFEPELVYTHFHGDLNRDHQIVSESVQVACRPVPGSRIRELLMFEVASSTGWRSESTMQFSPNSYHDISDTLESKMRALAAYAAEMRPWPHARSMEAVESQAKWRGASVGLDAAEAFVVARRIVR